GFPLTLLHSMAPLLDVPAFQTTIFQPSALLGKAELLSVTGPPTAVVKLHTVPVVVPPAFFSSIRQKYVVLFASVPGLYVVLVWFWMNGGGFAVPKRTSCDRVPLPAVQLSVGVTLTP